MMRGATSAGMRVIASLSVLGAAAGCSHANKADPGAEQESPVIAVQGWNAYPSAQVVGRLSLDKGCLLIGGSVAFWADGTTWDPVEQSVVFESGDQVEVGDQFSGGGGSYSRGDLRGLEAVDIDAVMDCLNRTGLRDAVVAVPPTPPG